MTTSSGSSYENTLHAQYHEAALIVQIAPLSGQEHRGIAEQWHVWWLATPFIVGALDAVDASLAQQQLKEFQTDGRFLELWNRIRR